MLRFCRGPVTQTTAAAAWKIFKHCPVTDGEEQAHCLQRAGGLLYKLPVKAVIDGDKITTDLRVGAKQYNS